MANGGVIAGALTFSTAIDNSDLEKGLEQAQKKVEELKEKLEKNESQKSAIEEKLNKASDAASETEKVINELYSQIQALEASMEGMDGQEWETAAIKVSALRSEVSSLIDTHESQVSEYEKIDSKLVELESEHQRYEDQLRSTKATASELAEQVSSTYYQAGVRVRESFNSMSSATAQFRNRLSQLVSGALVFSVISDGLRMLKQGIGEALQQNDLFSATWANLSATMQGFANGIANSIAPAIAQVVNYITACIVTLARAIDTVFKTGLVSAIGAARKTSEEAWRQTDESKAAAKQAEKNAKARAKQDEQYQKQAESYRKKQEASSKRLAEAEEKAQKRLSKAEQKYPDALEDAAERQAKAEEDMQERISKAERKAAERQTEAEEKAAKRLAKTEETASERNAAAQAAYEKKVAKAEERAAKQAEKAEKRRTKEAERLEKAQKKANATLLGFDEINKLNEESTTEATDALEDYTDYMADIDPAKVYEVDPSDYVIDPDDYRIDYEDYQIDPEKFFVDPDDYTFDPADYLVDPEDYALEPFTFDWEDYPEIDPTASLKPNWDAFDVGKIESTITAIMTILNGALLAVGAILAFSGINIPLGLALMAVGALGLATIVGENWEQLPAEVQAAITACLTLTGAVLIVLGAIIALSGANVPLGVGLMAAGFLLEWSAVALNWESMTPQMQSIVTTLMGILSGALLVIGAILAFGSIDPEHKALGIALMAAGAVGLAASVALAWDSMDAQMQQTLTALLTTIGTFAIVIGVVLLLAVPGQQPLGIGLILTGVALLGSAVALNWETLSETLVPVLQQVLETIGNFAIIIGVVLLFVPGQLALGIGLIIFGIAALEVSEMLADWDSLDTTLSSHLETLLKTVGNAAVVLGTVLLFVPGHIALGIGLIVFGVAAITTSEIIPEWDSMDDKLGLVLDKIVGTVTKFMLVIGVILLLVPGHRAIGLGLIVGGISILVFKEVAENWEAMDLKLNEVLGTLLKTVGTFMTILGVVMLFASGGVLAPVSLGLIVGGITLLKFSEVAENWDGVENKVSYVLEQLGKAVGTALFIIGVVMLIASGGTLAPIAIGLMVAGVATYATAEVVDWDFIVNKVKEVWGKIKQWWNDTVAPIFTADWWFNLFKSIFNGLIGVLNDMGTTIGGWLDDLSYNLGEIVGASGGTYNPPAIRVSNIPPLATGAVIPPNRRFMAVLGDQTHGNNLEAPEGLMRQVVREEAGAIVAEALLAMQAGQQGQEGGDLVVPLIIDSEELARAVFRGQGRLSRRGMASIGLDFA